jgi:hypothetical protein
MQAALFPLPQLTTTAPGQVGLSAAIAKTFRIDRTWFVGPATNWVPIQTNTLTSPNWVYSDPLAGISNAAFYRAVWLK